MIKTKTICLVLHKFSGGGELVNLQSHKGKVASLQLSFPTTRLPPPLFPHKKNGAMILYTRICTKKNGECA